MKVKKSDFIKYSYALFEQRKDFEVIVPFGEPGALRFRDEKFPAEEYETPEDHYAAVMDFKPCIYGRSERVRRDGLD